MTRTKTTVLYLVGRTADEAMEYKTHKTKREALDFGCFKKDCCAEKLFKVTTTTQQVGPGGRQPKKMRNR